MINREALEEIKKLKAISDVGLLYCSSEYDRERYTELKNISLRLMDLVSGHGMESLRQLFPVSKDYPTAKVDVRGFILSPDRTKILLAKESVDGKWSLPGGWADVGYSPREIVIKECKEETGVDVVPEKLIAVFDKRLHPHPPEPFYVYKMIFWCIPVSSGTQKGFDIMEVDYFDINDLPELSENRILKSQLALVYNKIISAEYETYFD